MIKVIMGLKGSGKTKQLINAIQDAVATEAGDIVCIEYGKKLTYDVNYKVRLVDSEEYGIKNVDMLKGLISGLHAGNFFQILKQVTDMSDQVKFGVGSDYGAPDVLFSGLAISGK